ncbi:hypothetical protein [Pseudonocardia thermophila]|uniref:hypothetical protein n=1 Tax=Pseudonocardia thermophila TaxID=1848 RepID=UPI00248D838F|nr:hypothetical protein [Pseudonocardia thermophila]
MKFTVDPWDPSYGTGLDTELGASSALVDPDVEVPAARWAPIDPVPVVPPSAVLFVDGVRRVDAQVWVDQGKKSAPALCASYAAGVMCCCPDQGAHLVVPQVRRGLFTTARDAVDIVTSAGTYTAVPTAERADVAPMQLLTLALQRALGDVELEVAERAREGVGEAGDLLVVDGPLRGRAHLPRAIGFVKSHRSDYLPPQLGGVVAALEPGQRTPVFALGTSWERHTWYLRLPGAAGAPWAGVVRVEAPAGPASVELAALSQATLVRYASTAYKDARAPQNLYPIAGLERALRRRLGEPAVLYRALRRAAAKPILVG